MESVKEFSKQVKGKKKFRAFASREFISKYFTGSLKQFKKGIVYAFRYDNPKTADQLEFFDKTPIVLVHKIWTAKKTKNKLISGINLNFFPEKEKIEILEAYYQIHNSDTPTFSAAKFLKTSSLVNSILAKSGKSLNYMFCYRTYIIDIIDGASEVSFDDWKYIPYFLPEEFEKKTLPQVLRLYKNSVK